MEEPVVGFAAEPLDPAVLKLFALLFELAYLFKAKPLTCSTVEMPPKILEKPLLLFVEEPAPAVLLT